MPSNFQRQSFSLPLPMLQDLKEEARVKDLSLSQVLRHYLRSGGLGQQQGRLDLLRTEDDDHGNQ